MQYAYPLLAIFIWAGNTVVNKLAVGSIFPAEIGFYRWLLAAILFTPFMLKPVIANWALIRPNLGKITVLGVLGMAVYQSLAYYAASLTSATNMGIILCRPAGCARDRSCPAAGCRTRSNSAHRSLPRRPARPRCLAGLGGIGD